MNFAFRLARVSKSLLRRTAPREHRAGCLAAAVLRVSSPIPYPPAWVAERAVPTARAAPPDKPQCVRAGARTRVCIRRRNAYSSKWYAGGRRFDWVRPLRAEARTHWGNCGPSHTDSPRSRMEWDWGCKRYIFGLFGPLGGRFGTIFFMLGSPSPWSWPWPRPLGPGPVRVWGIGPGPGGWVCG